MKHNYFHLLNRICSAPLAIESRHLAPILGYLGTRMGIDFVIPIEAAAGAAQQERETFPNIPGNIGVVDVSGPLVRRATGMDALCGMSSYEQIEHDYIEALNDQSKQAIVMLFDSPGGEVGSLFDLADLIQANRGKKPVYAAVSEMAFSAAYALASACDRIFVTRTAGVGSIGVFTAHCDQSVMDKQNGLSFKYIFAGKKKVDGNPHEPLSAEAEATIQGEIDRANDLFVQTVARNRKLTAKTVKNTEAGLFFGAEAVDIGLADEVGTVSEVVAALQVAIAIGSKSRPSMSAAAESDPKITEIPAIPAKTEAISPILAGSASESGPMPAESPAAQPPAAAASAPNSTQEKSMADELKTDATAPDTKVKMIKATKDCPTCDGTGEVDGKDCTNCDGTGQVARKASAKVATSIDLARTIAAEQQAAVTKPTAADPKEVIFLCGIAKCPQAASGFISRDLTLEQVRAELLAAQVAKEQAPGAIGHFVPASTGHLPMDKLDSLAKARAASTGEPFAKAYLAVLRENPKLYVDYLNQKDAALAGLRN